MIALGQFGSLLGQKDAKREIIASIFVLFLLLSIRRYFGAFQKLYQAVTHTAEWGSSNRGPGIRSSTSAASILQSSWPARGGKLGSLFRGSLGLH